MMSSTQQPPEKRLKEDESNNMEVDELLTAENKENFSKKFKQMSRKDLEDLVLTKTIEALYKHTEVGKTRMIIFNLQKQKDTLQQKVVLLGKQISEMGKAVKILLENQIEEIQNPHSTKPKKLPQPLKYYRSVGLQVNIKQKETSIFENVVMLKDVGIEGEKTFLRNNKTVKKKNPLKEPSSSSFAKNDVKSGGNSSKGKTSLENIQTQTVKNFARPISKPLLKNGLSQTVTKAVTQMKGSLASTHKTYGVSTKLKTTSDININSDENIIKQKIANENYQAHLAKLSTSVADDKLSSMKPPPPPTTTLANKPIIISKPVNGFRLVQPREFGKPPILATIPREFRFVMFTNPSLQKSLSTTTNRAVISRQKLPKVVQTIAPNITPPTTLAMSPTVTSTISSVPPPQPPIASEIIPTPPPTLIINAKCQTSLSASSLKPDSPVPAKAEESPKLPPFPIADIILVPSQQIVGSPPPMPTLGIKVTHQILLSWTLPITDNHAKISFYQIYVFQEPLDNPGVNPPFAWKPMEQVKGLPLPMACVMSKFTDGYSYYWIIRGVDCFKRSGPFSKPEVLRFPIKK